MERGRKTERRRWMWPTEGQSLSINMKNYLSRCPLCPHVSAHTHTGEQADLWGNTDWIFSGINRDLAQCNDIWMSWLAIWWHFAVWPLQPNNNWQLLRWGCIQTARDRKLIWNSLRRRNEPWNCVTVCAAVAWSVMVIDQFSCGLSLLRRGQITQAVTEYDHEGGEGQKLPKKAKVQKQI